MSAHTNPKTLIYTILNGNIVCLDDQGSPQQIPGKVIAGWYDKRFIGADKWLVTIGPTVSAIVDPFDIGANSWWEENIVQIDIWIPLLKDSTTAPLYYKPERIRFTLKESIKSLLQAQLVDAASDVRFIRLIGWQDLDEKDNDLLRVQMTVSVEWEE